MNERLLEALRLTAFCLDLRRATAEATSGAATNGG